MLKFMVGSSNVSVCLESLIECHYSYVYVALKTLYYFLLNIQTTIKDLYFSQEEDEGEEEL